MEKYQAECGLHGCGCGALELSGSWAGTVIVTVPPLTYPTLPGPLAMALTVLAGLCSGFEADSAGGMKWAAIAQASVPPAMSTVATTDQSFEPGRLFFCMVVLARRRLLTRTLSLNFLRGSCGVVMWL